jgi:F0F1-type ATP synthase delta subunit
MRAHEAYAESLFDAALALGCLDEVYGELPSVAGLMEECGRYLRDPHVGTAEKTSVLLDLLTGKVHPLTLQFLLLVLGRGHLRHMSDASKRFMQECADYYGYTTVRLRIPFEPDPGLLERLRPRLAEHGLISGRSMEKAEFQIELEEGLIGGFIAQCGGSQIDASLRTALVKLGKVR